MRRQSSNGEGLGGVLREEKWVVSSENRGESARHGASGRAELVAATEQGDGTS